MTLDLSKPLPPLRYLRGGHYLTDLDYTREDLEALLQLSATLKALWKKRRLTPFLPGKHLAMIFEAASTRTRVSFENGFAELGGNALYLRPGEIHLPGRESIADTARTLAQYNAAIEIRAKKNETVNELAAWSTVPVINGMDHDRHPCQSMSDAFTILEHAGKLEGVTFAYVGDAAHPCNSLSTTLTKLGMNVRIGNAPGYEIGDEVRRSAERFATESGGSFLLTNDPQEAIAGADFIYTDCWSTATACRSSSSCACPPVAPRPRWPASCATSRRPGASSSARARGADPPPRPRASASSPRRSARSTSGSVAGRWWRWRRPRPRRRRSCGGRRRAGGVLVRLGAGCPRRPDGQEHLRLARPAVAALRPRHPDARRDPRRGARHARATGASPACGSSACGSASTASERIKQMRGNPDAVASAYSLYDYRIADDLGGEAAYANLRDRAWARGIRLASDMVPNHMGIDSRWVIEHPDWFLSLDRAALPGLLLQRPRPVAGRAGRDRPRGPLLGRQRRRRRLQARRSPDRRRALHLPRQRRHELAVERHRAARLPRGRGPRAGHPDDPRRRPPLPDHPLRRGHDPRQEAHPAAVVARAGDRRRASRRAPSTRIPQARVRPAMPVEFWREVVDRVAAEVPGHAPAGRGLLAARGLLRADPRHAPGLQQRVHAHAPRRGQRRLPAGHQGHHRVRPGDPQALRQLHEQPRRADRDRAVRQGRQVLRGGDRARDAARAADVRPRPGRGLRREVRHGVPPGDARRAARSVAGGAPRARDLPAAPPPGVVRRVGRLPAVRLRDRRRRGRRGRLRLLERPPAPSGRSSSTTRGSPRRAAGSANRSRMRARRRTARSGSSGGRWRTASGCRATPPRSSSSASRGPGWSSSARAREIWEHGLDVSLDAYGTHVYWEFREVRDGAAGQWAPAGGASRRRRRPVARRRAARACSSSRSTRRCGRSSPTDSWPRSSTASRAGRSSTSSSAGSRPSSRRSARRPGSMATPAGSRPTSGAGPSGCSRRPRGRSPP